jgi:glycosyltransferase involved in cell wall biosynthesis
MTALAAETERDYRNNHDLIYTGGFTNHRGLVQIVEALQYVEPPGTRLILLGKTIDREAEETARELPGFDRVDYLGMLPYDEMYQHLQAAAIGLVCNQPAHDYHLAQPTKLFEYMSAGLPVIASAFELWHEVVEGNECGMTVDPTSPRKIAKTINYLLQHPDLRRRMSENGRTAILEEYNWDRERRKLLSLYKEILG